MKKPIAVLLAVLIALSITGCSSEIVHTPRASSSEADTSSSGSVSSNVQSAATADEPQESSAPVVEETYWTREPLDVFGLEKVPEPKDMEFFETLSSITTMYITWKVKNLDNSSQQLVNSIIKALGDKGIVSYSFKDGVKGGECKSADDAQVYLSDANALFEMGYRYNNIDYKLSVIALYGSGSQAKMKFVTLSIYNNSGLESVTSEE